MLKKSIVAVLNRIPRSEYVVEYLQGKKPLTEMTEWQQAFCEWNAERLGISLERSIERYRRSWNAIRSGHRGRFYRYFSILTHDVFGVFFDDTLEETFGSYQYHSYLDFLRFLSYREFRWAETDPVFQHLRTLQEPVILDFGCGLAHRSISLAKKLKAHGCKPRIFLADIPTLRKDFLTWFCAKLQIPMTFLDCTEAQPIPAFSACDLCIATEVFEHLHDPVRYFLAMDATLRPGGFLVTQIVDHHKEFFHVSPRLGALRTAVKEKSYEEIAPCTLYRKPGATAQ